MWAKCRNSIVKWSSAYNGLMSSAVLLLPLMAAAESRIQTAAAGAASSATAQVNFKIVIPKVLYLRVDSDMADGDDRTAGAQNVAVMSNSRNVTVNATLRDMTPNPSSSDLSGTIRNVRNPTSSNSATATSDSTARGSVILSASARRIIAQNAACTLVSAPAAATPVKARDHPNAETNQVICTASMP
jgi:hypothetical protein